MISAQIIIFFLNEGPPRLFGNFLLVPELVTTQTFTCDIINTRDKPIPDSCAKNNTLILTLMTLYVPRKNYSEI
jgi:hypothetical protein